MPPTTLMPHITEQNSPSFTLDTSGSVFVQRATSGGPFEMHWTDLDPFTQGYVEALFAAHSIERYHAGTGRTYSHGGFDMLAPETLQRIIEDCAVLVRRVLAKRYPATGKFIWELRQSGEIPDFPPARLTLSPDGLIRFDEGAG